MLSGELSTAERVVIDSMAFVSERVVVGLHDLILPSAVNDAFELTDCPLDLLLDAMPLIQATSDSIGRSKCKWLLKALSSLLLRLMDVDYTRMPQPYHKDAYIALVVIDPVLVSMCSVFHVCFEGIVQYPDILRGLLRQQYTQLAVQTMRLHGTPHEIEFIHHILPILVRIGDTESLNMYIEHTVVAHPEHRYQASEYTYNVLEFQLDLLKERLLNRKAYNKSIPIVKTLHSLLSALVDQNTNPLHLQSIECVRLIKATLWLVTQAYERTHEYTQEQINQSQLCLADLLIKTIECTSNDNAILLRILVATRLCSSAVSFNLGLRLSSVFKIESFAGKFINPANFMPIAQHIIPFYKHQSFVQQVYNKTTHNAMDKLFRRCGLRLELGIDLQTSPSIDKVPQLPARILISLQEVCEPTTGLKDLDAFINSQRYRNCRITFLVNLDVIDCSQVLRRLFIDPYRVKIGLNLKHVSHKYLYIIYRVKNAYRGDIRRCQRQDATSKTCTMAKTR